MAFRAQFGEGFQRTVHLRRRRNELEYPTVPGESASADETLATIDDARASSSPLINCLPNSGLIERGHIGRGHIRPRG